MIKFIFLTFLYSLNIQAFSLSSEVYKTSHIPFLSHQGPGEWDSYLTLELDYAPVKELFLEVQASQDRVLKTRNEAHITVITPPEFFRKLSSHLSMNEIDQLAKSMHIQDSFFTVECLGRATLGTKATYYVIVSSPELVKIRRAIKKLFVDKGGDPQLFDPKDFYPHITLGYTDQDLHKDDGITKNLETCISDIDIR
jgi:2'-5' RNA ligase